MSFPSKAWYAARKEEQRKIAGALRRMFNRKLSMAWERWQYWYEELLEQRWKIAGALRRMLKRKLSMAWETWQAWYSDLEASAQHPNLPFSTLHNAPRRRRGDWQGRSGAC